MQVEMAAKVVMEMAAEMMQHVLTQRITAAHRVLLQMQLRTTAPKPRSRKKREERSKVALSAMIGMPVPRYIRVELDINTYIRVKGAPI